MHRGRRIKGAGKKVMCGVKAGFGSRGGVVKGRPAGRAGAKNGSGYCGGVSVGCVYALVSDSAEFLGGRKSWTGSCADADLGQGAGGREL